LLIIGGLSFLLYQSNMLSLFVSKKRLLHFLDSLGPWAFAGFIGVQALQVVVAPIPGEATGLLGGYLYGPYLGILLSTAGLTLGSCAAFALARIFGRPFAEKFVPKPAMERFNYLLQHKGLVLVFLLFLIPGIPKDYLCYILGLGHLSTTQFLVVGTVGRLFGTILLTLGGSFLRVEQYGRFTVLLVISAVIVVLAMVFREKIERALAFLHVKHLEETAQLQAPDNWR